MAQDFEHTTAFEVEIPVEDRGIPASDKGPTSAEIALIERRELAVRATDAISEVLEVDVTIPALIMLADQSETQPVRLAAVRALRCVEAIARDDSAVVAAVGEHGIYHYVEGVIQYGASEKNYLALMEAHQLDAVGVTALYDLREQVATYTNGRKPGFRAMHEALLSIGISSVDAANDPETAVRALDEAGYFIDHVGTTQWSRIFDQPIFAPNLTAESARIVEDDIDGTMTRGILEGIKSHFSRHPEEIED